jgi:hypothetical protein
MNNTLTIYEKDIDILKYEFTFQQGCSLTWKACNFMPT